MALVLSNFFTRRYLIVKDPTALALLRRLLLNSSSYAGNQKLISEPLVPDTS